MSASCQDLLARSLLELVEPSAGDLDDRIRDALQSDRLPQVPKNADSAMSFIIDSDSVDIRTMKLFLLENPRWEVW